MSYFSRFSPELTSYDLVKFFAVVTMIIDHVGYFFFPEEEWFRVVGRMSFPFWMFLIGYANTREIPKSFIVGGVILTFVNIAFSNFVFPVTLFVTFMLTRLLLDRMARIAFSSIESATTMFWTFVVLALPSYLMFEYGTLAFLLALFGYAVRHKEKIKLGPRFVPVFSACVVAAYVGLEMLFFGFMGVQAIVFAVLLAGVGGVLYNFSAQSYPDLTTRMPSIPKWILRVCGRYSLEIYVVHLSLFLIVSKLMSPDFVWFMPKLHP